MKYFNFFLIFLFSNISLSQEIFIPNAFTPDGDNLNDYFGVIFSEEESIDYFSFIIFNRKGEPVFKTNEVSSKWPGGDVYFAPQEIFTYRIEWRQKQSKDIVVKCGNILLIR